MKIRCKTRCTSVQQNKDGDGRVYSEVINLMAVYSDDPKSENKAWAKYTPNFSLSMQIDNPSAFGAFEAGKEYFVDFTPEKGLRPEEVFSGLRSDGPTLEEYLAAGYAAENYPPEGFALKASTRLAEYLADLRRLAPAPAASPAAAPEGSPAPEPTEAAPEAGPEAEATEAAPKRRR